MPNMCTKSHRSTARRPQRVLHRPARTVALTDVWCLRPAPWSMAKAWLWSCKATSEALYSTKRARHRSTYRTPRRPCARTLLVKAAWCAHAVDVACSKCFDAVRALSSTELRRSPCNSTATPWPSTRVQVEDTKHRSARQCVSADVTHVVTGALSTGVTWYTCWALCAVIFSHCLAGTTHHLPSTTWALSFSLALHTY